MKHAVRKYNAPIYVKPYFPQYGDRWGLPGCDIKLVLEIGGLELMNFCLFHVMCISHDVKSNPLLSPHHYVKLSGGFDHRFQHYNCAFYYM